MIDIETWWPYFEAEQAKVRERARRREADRRENFEQLARDPEKVRQYHAANRRLNEEVGRLATEYEEWMVAAVKRFEEALPDTP